MKPMNIRDVCITFTVNQKSIWFSNLAAFQYQSNPFLQVFDILSETNAQKPGHCIANCEARSSISM